MRIVRTGIRNRARGAIPKPGESVTATLESSDPAQSGVLVLRTSPTGLLHIGNGPAVLASPTHPWAATSG